MGGDSRYIMTLDGESGVGPETVLVGNLEGNPVGYAHDQVSSFRVERCVEVALAGCLGALLLDGVLLYGDNRTFIVIMAFLLGLLIYGEYTGEYVLLMEIEHP